MKKLLCLLTLAFASSIFAAQAEDSLILKGTQAQTKVTAASHPAKKHRKKHHHKRRKHHRVAHHVSFASSNGVHWQK